LLADELDAAIEIVAVADDVNDFDRLRLANRPVA
jgi:hypothetical protein